MVVGGGRDSPNPEGQSGDETAESDNEPAFRNQFIRGLMGKPRERLPVESERAKTTARIRILMNEASAFDAALKLTSESEPSKKRSGHNLKWSHLTPTTRMNANWNTLVNK